MPAPVVHSAVIPYRYRGPKTSGNGGYSCGVIGKHLDGAVEVTLRVPPPLDHEMSVEVEGETARLMDGDKLVGEARTRELELDVPEPPTMEQARAATAHYIGHKKHPLPECFVCGTSREGKDALCLFTGKVEGRELVAAPWTPDTSLPNENGVVTPEVVWAALDCPSYFGTLQGVLFALLGRLTARIDGEVRVGEDYVVIGWPRGQDGRKYYGASAIYAADGTLVACADAVWIQVDPSKLK